MDAGTSKGGARIVTAGGLSCGIDGALWIVSEMFGLEKAVEVAHVMDHMWRFDDVDLSCTEGRVI